MPNPSDSAPLIVTALLGEASFQYLDRLRQLHFPKALNKVPAHLSLFHHLPGWEALQVLGRVRHHCRSHASFEMRPSRLVNLGRGVAIGYEPGPLGPLHAALAREFSDWLTPQDRQPFKPHVTIQNKASGAQARSLQDAMLGEALPSCRIEGLSLWWYRGGPWEAYAACRFDADQ